MGELIQNLPYEEYAKIGGIRASHLKQIRKSPAHYKAALTNNKTTDALEFGKLFHSAVLEPELFRSRMVLMPDIDRRTKAGKEEYKIFMENLRPEMIVVSEEQSLKIGRMIEAAFTNKTLRAMLEKGSREVTYKWEDSETGLLCQARWDFVTEDGYPLDLKTIAEASFKKIENAIFGDDYSYYLQAGHYSAGATHSKVVRDDLFIFVFIEKEEPHGIVIKTLDHYTLDAGKWERSQLLKKIKPCIQTGVYPGYAQFASPAVPPRWFEEKFKDME